MSKTFSRPFIGFRSFLNSNSTIHSMVYLGCLQGCTIERQKSFSKNHLYVRGNLCALKFARDVEIHTLALRRK